jgi:predicted CoA-binding protein
MALLEDDAALRGLIDATHSIAVLGIKAGEGDDAFRVPRYLQRAGFRILPVNPKLERVLDEPVAARLAAIDEPFDLVNVFRDARHLPAHVDEILALPRHPAAVWFQLGIRDDASAARLAAAGLDVVQDRCLMVEHRRLLGGVSA